MQQRPDVAVVVDFAVENDVVAHARRHRLVAGGEIDNRQPSKGQHGVRLGDDPHTLGIGTAMHERPHRAPERLAISAGYRAAKHAAEDAAHARRALARLART